MTKPYRCVICLAKSGSSQIAKNFRHQGAVHEYDFKRIAELTTVEDGKRKEIIIEHMKKRRKMLEGKIDVSTSLVHLCDSSIVNMMNMRPVFLIRNPLDWITSVIKYANYTNKIGELELDGGWRKRYGKNFIPNDEIDLREINTLENNIVDKMLNPLLEAWIVYTSKIYNMALACDQSLNNIYTTESLSNIETHKKISNFYDISDVPPIDFFLISNKTEDIDGIKRKIIKIEPKLKLINLKNIYHTKEAINAAKSILNTRRGSHE